jgi:hypothetical protein
MSAEQELVPVYVPRHALAKVAGLLRAVQDYLESLSPETDYGHAARAPAETPGQRDGDLIEGREWPVELLERSYYESPPSIQRILKLLASEPDKAFTLQDFADMLDVSKLSVSGALGAYARRTKYRYRRAHWPFHVWRGEDGTWRYSMKPETADVLAQLG